MTKPLWRFQTLARQAHSELYTLHDAREPETGCCKNSECSVAMLMHNIDSALGRKIKPTYEGDEV